MATNNIINQNRGVSRAIWLYRAGGVACWSLVLLFAFGITGLASTGSRWQSVQNNWLMVLFKLNAQDSAAQTSMLNMLSVVDLAIMLLSGVAFLALNQALRRTHKIWSATATALLFLGIILFVITHTAGRSALLIGALIYSVIMLSSGLFSRVCGYIGIAASGLLFFGGDIGTTIWPPSVAIALLIGIGYML